MDREFNELYLHHASAVFRRALRLLESATEAHAVVFEVFDGLLARPEQYVGSRGMSTFVHGAATHACLGRLRKRHGSNIPAEQPDADARLRALLVRVPGAIADFVVYRYMDELTHDEIARVLECSHEELVELLEHLSAWEREHKSAPFERQRPEACPSDLLLDALSAHDLADKVVVQLNKHLSHCVRCQAQRAVLESASAAFLQAAPGFESEIARANAAKPVAQAKPVRKRAVAQRVWLARALALATLVALAIFLMRHSGVAPAPRGQVVPKLGFVIERAGQVLRGTAEAIVQADDRVRFTYSSDRDVYFALLKVSAPHASAYYPATGTHPAAVHGGSDMQLSRTVQLDGKPGIEQVVGVFCRAPFEIPPLLAALDASRELPNVGDCHVDELQLKKLPVTAVGGR